MSNAYGIPEEDEKEIRIRDRTCVYCRKSMKRSPHSMHAFGATIEHFNNDGYFDKKWNVAICCRGCNSSKGNKELLAWFKTPYCIEKNINQKTVAKAVKEYIRGRT
jgi:5-methylcytosine-specific restriction endonuclease McrA